MRNNIELIRLATDIMRFAVVHSHDGFSVFADYSPHINALEVRVYPDGWKRGSTAPYWKTVYLEFDSAERQLKRILGELIEMTKE
jgi:hypothetical protein